MLHITYLCKWFGQRSMEPNQLTILFFCYLWCYGSNVYNNESILFNFKHFCWCNICKVYIYSSAVWSPSRNISHLNKKANSDYSLFLKNGLVESVLHVSDISHLSFSLRVWCHIIGLCFTQSDLLPIMQIQWSFYPQCQFNEAPKLAVAVSVVMI